MEHWAGNTFGFEYAHQYEVEASEEPTCGKDGWQNRRCTTCGDEKYTVIPATGHIADESTVVIVPSTGTDFGSKTYTCTICNETITETLPLGGHNLVTLDDGVAPTCTETGLTATVICDICNEVVEPQKILPVTHQLSIELKNGPYCEKEGYTFVLCEICDEKIILQEGIPPLGHSFYEGECVRCDALDFEYYFPDGYTFSSDVIGECLAGQIYKIGKVSSETYNVIWLGENFYLRSDGRMVVGDIVLSKSEYPRVFVIDEITYFFFDERLTDWFVEEICADAVQKLVSL